MNPLILSLSTTNPPNVHSQKEIASKLIDMLSLEEDKIRILQRIYENSSIESRYSVIDDFCKENTELSFWGKDYLNNPPGTLKRNNLYKEKASDLAHQACLKAISSWGGDVTEITHVISVSCTGVMAPGIEFRLIKSLGLQPTVQRLGINLMGCFGAFKGLQVASAYARENPNHRILVVCTELCSLHLQSDLSTETILANSLFSDGAAAAIVGCQSRPHEKALFSMIQHHSFALEDTLDKMTWEVGDHGFFMHLSSFVPSLIKRHIHSFIDPILKNYTSISECNWAIHPGGKSILDAVERSLNLSKEQTQAAWQVLANYGNMSSATFLFILERLAQQQERNPWTVGLGFGPGLSIEGVLLRDGEA